jgi:hypothetical protein
MRWGRDIWQSPLCVRHIASVSAKDRHEDVLARNEIAHLNSASSIRPAQLKQSVNFYEAQARGLDRGMAQQRADLLKVAMLHVALHCDTVP